MIRFKNAFFEYDDNNIILNDVSFDIDANQITVLLGKNGAGKTTILNIIDGMLQLGQGDIYISDEVLYITDNPSLYNFLTGREYIDLISSLGSINVLNRIDFLVESLNLKTGLDKLIEHYSLGMKHKLALLTALILNHKHLIIDEPLASLDPSGQDFMIEYFKQIKHDRILFVTTHMLDVAFRLADKILIIDDKKVVTLNNDFQTFEEFRDKIKNFFIT